MIPAEIMLVLRRMEMPEHVQTVEQIADWMWTKHESDTTDAAFQFAERREAEHRVKVLAEALRVMVALEEER